MLKLAVFDMDGLMFDTEGVTARAYVEMGQIRNVPTTREQFLGYLGMNADEAKSKLTELGLTVETVTDDESKEPEGTVISSSPLPYGKVEQGTVVTLTVSSGKGDKKTVDVIVELPSYVSGSLQMSVIVDGVTDSSLSQTVYPSDSSSVKLSFEGSGKQTVVIELDGQVYREYTIDFALGSVTNTVAHDFVVETEPPTEAPTQPETYATEYVPDTQPETNAVDNGY